MKKPDGAGAFCYQRYQNEAVYSVLYILHARSLRVTAPLKTGCLPHDVLAHITKSATLYILCIFNFPMYQTGVGKVTDLYLHERKFEGKILGLPWSLKLRESQKGFLIQNVFACGW